MGMTDNQFKDSLRRDKFLNELMLEALKNGDIQKVIEYIEADNERIQKALEE